jgi:hypothetical protein
MEEPQEKTLRVTSIEDNGDTSTDVPYSSLSIDQLVKLAMDGYVAAREELAKRLGGIDPLGEDD